MKHENFVPRDKLETDLAVRSGMMECFFLVVSRSISMNLAGVVFVDEGGSGRMVQCRGHKYGGEEEHPGQTADVFIRCFV
jgi:hypothetical protein